MNWIGASIIIALLGFIIYMQLREQMDVVKYRKWKKPPYSQLLSLKKLVDEAKPTRGLKEYISGTLKHMRASDEMDKDPDFGNLVNEIGLVFEDKYKNLIHES